MTVTIRTMDISDFDDVLALMRATDGVTVRDADSKDAVHRYLVRNPGFSFVAEVEGVLAGCIMSGHDGRRGYLQHLIVAPGHRRSGIATRLVDACLNRLAAEGIRKSHVDVLATNAAAAEFWRKIGWTQRTDIIRFSVIRGGGANA
jgi:ribosomal protein S18 acetylase RimI-like enzyme